MLNPNPHNGTKMKSLNTVDLSLHSNSVTFLSIVSIPIAWEDRFSPHPKTSNFDNSVLPHNNQISYVKPPQTDETHSHNHILSHNNETFSMKPSQIETTYSYKNILLHNNKILTNAFLTLTSHNGTDLNIFNVFLIYLCNFICPIYLSALTRNKSHCSLVFSFWDWVPIKKTTHGRPNKCQVEQLIVTIRLLTHCHGYWME